MLLKFDFLQCKKLNISHYFIKTMEQFMLTPASAPSETPQVKETQPMQHNIPPPQYEPVKINSFVEQCDQITERYKRELRTLKDNINQHIDDANAQNDEYKKLKQQKEQLMQERTHLSEIKIAFQDSKKNELLNEINNKIAGIESEMIKHDCNQDRIAALALIDNLLKERQPQLIIGRNHPNYIKDYEKCMDILKPYIDKEEKRDNQIVRIQFKKTKTDEDFKLCMRLQKSIIHGKEILGYYLKVNKTSSNAVCSTLCTIFSYLGFTSELRDDSYFLLSYDADGLQRFYYTDIGKLIYTTDYSYAHNLSNFKNLIE